MVGEGGLGARSVMDGEPLFHEYFHGDDGTGLGVSHQTGWTGPVAVTLDRRAGGATAGGMRRLSARYRQVVPRWRRTDR
ncbi:hypothetical protein BH24ACT7_BH24ACT7_25500 [soil metagenome]